jgi:hypothetical protein
MEGRANCLAAVCILFLVTAVSASLEITRIPHGLLESNETVQSCTAMYHLVVVFGGPKLMIEQDEDIGEQIDELAELIKRSESEWMQTASSLLGQISTRYRAIAGKWNSDVQHPASETTAPGSATPPLMPATGSTRTRRGLFNFVGTLEKSLFGVATEEDVFELQKAVDSNRNSLSVISHQYNKMLIVVNATRFQVLENNKAINELINAT